MNVPLTPPPDPDGSPVVALPVRFPARIPTSNRALDRAVRIFRALGEPGRLRLLERLLEGEWSVTELAAAVGVELSTVSHQLRVLRAENIVLGRREGKHIYYSLVDQHVVDLLDSVLAHAEEGNEA